MVRNEMCEQCGVEISPYTPRYTFHCDLDLRFCSIDCLKKWEVGLYRCEHLVPLQVYSDGKGKKKGKKR